MQHIVTLYGARVVLLSFLASALYEELYGLHCLCACGSERQTSPLIATHLRPLSISRRSLPLFLAVTNSVMLNAYPTSAHKPLAHVQLPCSLPGIRTCHMVLLHGMRAKPKQYQSQAEAKPSQTWSARAAELSALTLSITAATHIATHQQLEEGGA